MFVATAFVYPLVLAALCVGAGLLVDRLSGGFLPALLLPTVGAAALIAVSQLETYVAFAAPGTPYVMALLALAGVVISRERIAQLVRIPARSVWLLVPPLLVYVLALAPVIFAGRPSFSSYLVLGDSAIHMLGADFLLHHGQDYSHLDLATSNGQVINAYYNNSYPSGADTLFGGSALLLRLPLIWAFQPFNAFMLALAACPAWLLVRRMGVSRPVAVLGAVSVSAPALVYGYELIGSIKEIAALPMILTLGVLVVGHERWLRGSAWRGIPFALVLAAGVSALGVGFGAWGLGAAAVVAPILIGSARNVPDAGRALALVGTGAIVTLLASLPTWEGLSGALKVTEGIAGTGNPGNLRKPLHVIQIFGPWLRGTYKALPVGGSLTPTYILIAIVAVMAVVGAMRLLRQSEWVFAGWIAAMVLVWLAVIQNSTTWVTSKTLMLTSPVVALLAWGGVAALMRARRRRLMLPFGALLALVLVGGTLASDALQYHASDLAPTARFDELAHINGRFAGRGPALFTDFDEYSLYVLRDVGVAGPDFIYPPQALAGFTRYRYPVELDRVPPDELRSYPLIITRRDPVEPRPPSEYGLLWRGVYYEVWGRRGGAAAALSDAPLSGSLHAQCERIHYLSQIASLEAARLVGAEAPDVVEADIDHARLPAGWGRMHQGVLVNGAGRLSTRVYLPRSGVWDIWLQGQIMPSLEVGVDGRELASLAGQLGGNSVVPNTLTPVPVRLERGSHDLTITRGGVDLAPGNGGSAALFHVLLTPASADRAPSLYTASPARWRSLCGRSYEWMETIASVGGRT